MYTVKPCFCSRERSAEEMGGDDKDLNGGRTSESAVVILEISAEFVVLL